MVVLPHFELHVETKKLEDSGYIASYGGVQPGGYLEEKDTRRGLGFFGCKPTIDKVKIWWSFTGRKETNFYG